MRTAPDGSGLLLDFVLIAGMHSCAAFAYSFDCFVSGKRTFASDANLFRIASRVYRRGTNSVLKVEMYGENPFSFEKQSLDNSPNDRESGDFVNRSRSVRLFRKLHAFDSPIIWRMQGGGGAGLSE